MEGDWHSLPLDLWIHIKSAIFLLCVTTVCCRMEHPSHAGKKGLSSLHSQFWFISNRCSCWLATCWGMGRERWPSHHPNCAFLDFWLQMGVTAVDQSHDLLMIDMQTGAQCILLSFLLYNSIDCLILLHSEKVLGSIPIWSSQESFLFSHASVGFPWVVLVSSHIPNVCHHWSSHHWTIKQWVYVIWSDESCFTIWKSWRFWI